MLEGLYKFAHEATVSRVSFIESVGIVAFSHNYGSAGNSDIKTYAFCTLSIPTTKREYFKRSAEQQTAQATRALEFEAPDSLEIQGDEELPADIVPLACSGSQGQCYVSTAARPNPGLTRLSRPGAGCENKSGSGA